jgi:type IV secretion system protein VirB9
MEALKATQEQQRHAAEQQRQAADSIRTQLSDAARTATNWDYWVSGSDEISPTSARDDGRFMYLTFSRNRDMPAVYTVDESGAEALVPTHVQDGNTIVIQRMARRLMLRKGQAVAMVVNKSWNANGGSDNSTGTIAPGVERSVKGVKQ